MFERIGSRLLHIFLLAALLIGLGPTPAVNRLYDSLQVASTALAAGHPQSALEALESALTIEPQLGLIERYAAEASLAASQPTRALEHLRRAEILLGPSPKLDCLRSEALLGLGQTEAALSNLTPIDADCPQKQALMKHAAEQYLALGEYEAAGAVLENLLVLGTAEYDTVLQLGVLTAIQEPEKAIVFLRLADELNPDGSQLARDLTRAIEDARPAESPAYVLAQVGETLGRHGKWDMAAASFRAALEIEPAYIEALTYLGLALDLSGGDGLAELETAMEAAPRASIPAFFLARHWNAVGAHDQALAVLKEAQEYNPAEPAIAAELGATYAALGEIADAKIAYLQATDLSPQEPAFWLALATFSLTHEIEIADLALPAARNALALNPQDPAAADALGYGYFLLGNLPIAERLLLRAIQSDPQRAMTHYHLGLLRLAQGDRERAIAALILALQLDPEGSIGRLAERAIVRYGP